MAAQIGAQWGERNPEGITHRNGYRSRDWYTWVGTMELRIPKIREGSFFRLLDPRRRSEKALLSVVQQAYVEGVSTSRVDDLIKSLGCDGISKSQVSRICRDLDQVVDNFPGRALDAGPNPYVWPDALTQKVREGGRIVNVSVVVATGVNSQGQREVLSMDVGASEDGAFWLAFLRSLNARGLSGGVSHLRCSPGFEVRHRHRVCRVRLATLPHPLHDQPADPSAHAVPAKRRHHGAHHIPAISPEEVHAQADRVIAQLR
ncbi:MAG: transposase [Chloroflexi bacterium]|nr:transposase [Chloroflexota bacterium]